MSDWVFGSKGIVTYHPFPTVHYNLNTVSRRGLRDNVPILEPLTFVRDGGRTGSWTDWRIPIALKDIGVPPSKLTQEFFLNVKGLGGLITADSLTALRRPDLQYLTHPSIPEALRKHLLILLHNIDFVRPFGGKSRYHDNLGFKIQYIINGNLGIKVAPYISTTLLPIGTLRKIVEISKEIYVPRTYGRSQSRGIYGESLTREQVSIVQALRLLPSNIRGEDIVNQLDINSLVNVVAQLQLSQADFRNLRRYLLSDATRIAETVPKTLTRTGDPDILEYTLVSDVLFHYTTLKQLEQTRWKIPTQLLKDLVIAKTGAYFVDWESISPGTTMPVDSATEQMLVHAGLTVIEFNLLLANLEMGHTLIRNPGLMDDNDRFYKVNQEICTRALHDLIQSFNTSRHIQVRLLEDDLLFTFTTVLGETQMKLPKRLL